MTEQIRQVSSGLEDVVSTGSRLEGLIETACQNALFSDALESLSKISVEEFAKSKSGIRVAALKNAGYENMRQIAQATDKELGQIEGIGDKQVETIRSILSEFQNHLVEYSKIKVKLGDFSPENIALIASVFQHKNLTVLLSDTGWIIDSCEYFRNLSQDVTHANIARSGLQWFFSGKRKKEETSAIFEELAFGVYSDRYNNARDLLDRYEAIINAPPEVLMEDFERDSASYYAALEYYGGAAPKPLIYSSIPAQIANEIDSMDLDTSEFVGTLRSYQRFGAKYILYYGRALLGDEMGLGKTIQAIAVMTHLYAQNKNAHFLVVCPASVLVNWVREIEKFSKIPAHLVHGGDLEKEFSAWKSGGGVCVTNYESMGKIIDAIDNQMTMALMVIDEAHYIKNPDAKRTKYIHSLENESERILLMTGTPLENKVEEMCNLVDFVRPDMSEEIRKTAHMSRVPEFREMLAPVYLRRLREDVLDELPAIAHKEEWCTMTATDINHYVEAIRVRSFNDMRRVSFLQQDMMSSCKMTRIKEICSEAKEDGRKVIVYSFFRETVAKVEEALSPDVMGTITGSTEVEERQNIIDRFKETKDKHILVCQIQAGGTGLNIQAASIVVFCEPQIKPSLESQALSRVYRMGQNRNVLVHHVLCPETIDEAVAAIFNRKQKEFELYAHESLMGAVSENLFDKEWIKEYIDIATRKYLGGVV